MLRRQVIQFRAVRLNIVKLPEFFLSLLHPDQFPFTMTDRLAFGMIKEEGFMTGLFPARKCRLKGKAIQLDALPATGLLGKFCPTNIQNSGHQVNKVG